MFRNVVTELFGMEQMSRVLCVTLPIDLYERLEREATERNVTKTYIVREALKKYWGIEDE